MTNRIHTVGVYNQYVNEYVNKFMELDLYRDTFDFFIELLAEGCKILELGCGPGKVVKYLTTKRKDLLITGIDLAPDMIKEARKVNPEATFKVFDIENAGELKERFHAVTCAFCPPYLSYDAAVRLFTDVKNLTTDDRLLYVSCMEGPGTRSGFEKTSFTGESEMYINYYERDEIEGWIEQQGFTIKRLLTKDYPKPDGSITTDLIYIAAKGNAG